MSGRDRRRRKRSLLKSQGPFCYYCHLWWPDNYLTLDHVVPQMAGGKSSLDNLVLACPGCNTSKGSLSVHDFKELYA